MLEVKTFPKDMSVFEVNRSDARECFLSGLFEETVKLENGTRSFYTYLKSGLRYNQPCLVVAPPACDNILRLPGTRTVRTGWRRASGSPSPRNTISSCTSCSPKTGNGKQTAATPTT